jgi:hypothetical protein
VIGRPTTQQLLDDCARELRESVMPAVADPAVRVKLEMMEQIVASCALRAGNELAWIDEECDAMEAYAADVAGAFADADGASVGALVERYRAGRRGGLRLDDRVHDYDLAGRAFSAALALAMRRGHAGLTARARDMVTARNEREGVLRPNFSFPGRS